jgi:hypothetical protein
VLFLLPPFPRFSHPSVIPAKAGIPFVLNVYPLAPWLLVTLCKKKRKLDPRFRGDDAKGKEQEKTFKKPLCVILP